jgi:hypothetical protein
MKNIYIMSAPRSGSTYLFDLISQSADVAHLYKEPFNSDSVKYDTDLDMLNTYESKILDIKSHSTGILIKDTLRHIDVFESNSDYADVFKHLFLDFYQYINDNFYKIKLYRRNMFEQSLSNCIAALTDIWATNNNDYQFPVITVPIDYFKSTVAIHATTRKFLINYPHYDKIIYYEDLLSNYHATGSWMFDRIEQPHVLKPILTIPNPPKHRVVSNYNELFDWYDQHRHEYEIEHDN